MSLPNVPSYMYSNDESPMSKGLAAGLAAYQGGSGQGGGIGSINLNDLKDVVNKSISQAALQRNMAPAQPSTTGTSAAAYNYLMGQGQYPSTAVLAGQPGSALSSSTISKPYEQMTNIGGPTSTQLATAAQNSPSQMPSVNYGPIGVRQPSTLDQLTSLALPAYAAYKAYNALFPNGLGGKAAAGDGTGAVFASNADADAYGAEIAAGNVSAAPLTAATDAAAADTTVASAAADAGGSGLLDTLGSIASLFAKKGGLTSDFETKRMAHGGLSAAQHNLGDYSDGGRLLRGPGDGVSDSIPATIGGKRPARLADGEFVVPARIVSELGNGSTEAGARKLYAMMDRVQSARRKTIGKGRVANDTASEKYLPE